MPDARTAPPGRVAATHNQHTDCSPSLASPGPAGQPCVMSASRPEARSRKLPSTAWQPGRSGNPRGRPKAPFDIAAMCREHAAEAVATLVSALRDPKHKVAAAQALLDRGFGRPKQTIEAERGVTNISLHLLAARLISEQLVAEQKPSPKIEQRMVNDASVPTE